MTDDIENRFHFNTAIARCMELTNAISKYEFSPDDVAGASIQRDAMFALVSLMSPFAPHVTEELWEIMGGEGMASESPWPKWDDDIAADDVVTIAVQVMGKLRATIEVPSSCDKQEMERLALGHDNVKRHLEEKTIRKIVIVPGKLVNIVAN